MLTDNLDSYLDSYFSNNVKQIIKKYYGNIVIGENEYHIINGKLRNRSNGTFAILFQEEKGEGWNKRYKNLSIQPELFPFSPKAVVFYLNYVDTGLYRNFYQALIGEYGEDYKYDSIINLFDIKKETKYLVGGEIVTDMLNNLIDHSSMLSVKWIYPNFLFDIIYNFTGEEIILYKKNNFINLKLTDIFIYKKIIINDLTYYYTNNRFILNKNRNQVALLLKKGYNVNPWTFNYNDTINKKEYLDRLFNVKYIIDILPNLKYTQEQINSEYFNDNLLNLGIDWVDLNRDFIIGYQNNIGEYIKYKDEIHFKV